MEHKLQLKVSDYLSLWSSIRVPDYQGTQIFLRSHESLSCGWPASKELGPGTDLKN